LDEISSALENIINSGDYHPDTKIIWDIRKADFPYTDYHFIEKLVAIRCRFTKRKNGRSVLIASSDLQFGLGRMLQALSEPKITSQFMVFRDYEEGEKWLLEKNIH
ncbi:MAG: hypothetical protein JXI43_14020, partial [Tissierellales bacterium]|nr:hypothetical protein [Tissierellales bacterium]